MKRILEIVAVKEAELGNIHMIGLDYYHRELIEKMDAVIHSAVYDHSSLMGLRPDQLVAGVNYLLGPRMAMYGASVHPNCKNYRLLLSRFLEHIPGLWHLKHLQFNPHTLGKVIDWTMHGNEFFFKPTAAQMVLMLESNTNLETFK